MSFTGEFAIRAMLSQFDKRGSSGNQEHNSNDMSPGAILAIVIAALTLLVAVIPLFRCPRFHHWMFSSISPFFKKALGITLPSPVSTTATTPEDSSVAAAPEIPTLHPVFIYNDYSNASPVGTCSNAFRCNQDGISRGEGSVLQVEESLGLRKPERAVTYPFP